MLRLLSATPSPYVRKVRIALAEKGIPFELRTEVPWNEGAEVARINPLGKVPVLTLEDGTTLFDSRFILEWLETVHPAPPLLPAEPMDRLLAKQYEVVADGICDAIVLIVLERLRPAERRSGPWIARQQAKITAGLAWVAERLGDRSFAIGDRFGHADIALGAVLAFLDLRYPEEPWRTAHPALADYLAGLDRRPSFATTRPVAQVLQAGVV